ncbi:MAG: hypothetical protein LBH60_08740 [Prevotellaceae bacterium]|jgi:hypothetical protein|nr:hypothetical protein [Prevotellaceae bacterium]
MRIFKQIFAAATGAGEDNTIIFVRKHYKYIMLIFFLIVLYISNGLMYELEVRRQDKLEEKLLRAKVKYNTKLLDFRKFFNYRNLLDLSEKYDLKLEAPDRPPIKVEK